MKKNLLSLFIFLGFTCFVMISCTPKYSDSLVFIKGQTFTMSGDSVSLPEGFYPLIKHEVELSDFYISGTEVTQKDFTEIMGYNPSFFNGDRPSETDSEIIENMPVENVSWYEAIVYCNKLSIKCGLKPVYSMLINEENTFDTDKWGTVPENADSLWDSIVFNEKCNGYRLPTEAEWEYAAKGGNSSLNMECAGFSLSTDNPCDFAWLAENSENHTHQTGLLRANEIGLYDMTGNVCEWCWDFFDENYFTSEIASEKNTKGPEKGNYRVCRSSDFLCGDEEAYSVVRSSFLPYSSSRRIGFRIARNSK